ncbi:hypothetical protein Sango_3100000 [Sesamum angolense]|uniref:Reverse transcriptase domain-containing protein n=1 Tax=Sesamum angolense TaxID=2727404 RepID=A0AAE1T881_9LAMI|nr:hypothetical protein Sango_3100000 [Sesamum angolense]
MDRDNLEDGMTDEDRRFLCVMPTLEEVREELFSIEPDSVVGPDGFGVIFYHICWDVISEDVFSTMTEFFRGVEIPKELIHSLESRRPEANVVFKFDMVKIGSVGNSFISERRACGFFHSTQGLWQGDPLSPALFVLAVDYLSQGLDRLFAAHPSMYYQAPGRIWVSHLAYADDMMIFTNTCQQNMELLCDFLWEYERVSGQLINGMKSSFIVDRQGNRKACMFDFIISRLRDMLQGLSNDKSLPWKEAGLDYKCVVGHTIASTSGTSLVFLGKCMLSGGRRWIGHLESGRLCRAFSMKLWWWFWSRACGSTLLTSLGFASVTLGISLIWCTSGAWTLMSTQWKGDLHRAGALGFVFRQTVALGIETNVIVELTAAWRVFGACLGTRPGPLCGEGGCNDGDPTLTVPHFWEVGGLHHSDITGMLRGILSLDRWGGPMKSPNKECWAKAHDKASPT